MNLHVLGMAIQTLETPSLCFPISTKEGLFSRLCEDTIFQGEFFIDMSHPSPSFLSLTAATVSYIIYPLCISLQSLLSKLRPSPMSGEWDSLAPVMLTGRLVCSYRSSVNHLLSSRQLFKRSDDRPRKNVSVSGR